MIDAVFISDLHLNPAEPEISQRFAEFINWAAANCRRLYILGDFFHVWAGDDTLDDWSMDIAARLGQLSAQGIALYFMPGNRDFLLGDHFARLAGWTVLPDPCLIDCGQQAILLAHGDAFCTRDRAHQRFRRLTRSPWFSSLFLRLPQRLRLQLCQSVRQHSQRQQKSQMIMDVEIATVCQVAEAHGVSTLIHGHTHRPGLYPETNSKGNLQRYVLSDWDDRPQILCYDDTKGFYFTHY